MSEFKSVDCDDEQIRNTDTIGDDISHKKLTIPPKSAIQRIFHPSKLERFAIFLYPAMDPFIYYCQMLNVINNFCVLNIKYILVYAFEESNSASV